MEFRWWEIVGNQQIYLLVVTQEYIAKIKPKPDQLNKLTSELQQGRLPAQDLYKIPFSYVSRILIDESRPELKVLFQPDSEEIYSIPHGQQRFEVFDYLNKHTTHQGYELVKQSGLARAKKPIMAVLILSVIFGWAYYLADQMENGVDVGRQLAIILGLAGLGTQLLSMIYLGVMAVAFMALFRKLLQPSVEHVLRYH